MNQSSDMNVAKSKRKVIILAVMSIVGTCGLGVLLVWQQLPGASYPNAIVTDGSEFTVSPGYDHFRGKYSVSFFVNRQVNWYSEDTEENIVSHFISKGWTDLPGTTQGDTSELGKLAHHFSDPLSFQRYGSLTIQTDILVRARYNETTQRMVGDTNSFISVRITIDDPLSP
ncbi:MAG: hypothetical protein GY796_17300 [Chloroflexi bacterium]|nr:hypothetical protein [Chloroflexota bacterium]